MVNERGPRRGRAASFFTGFLIGILLTVLIGLAGAYYLINNPPSVIMKIANTGISKVVKKVSASIPKDYMARNQDEISELLSRFVKAYANGKITPEDMDVLTQKGFEFSADQKITEKEIRQMLDLIGKYAG